MQVEQESLTSRILRGDAESMKTVMLEEFMTYQVKEFAPSDWIEI